MAESCPHCGASVTLQRRHGLSGALCPECHNVVPFAGDGGPRGTTPMPRIVRPQRAEVVPTCRACGGGRDREARRCPVCGESWLYRVGAMGVDDETARTRLLEYVLNRQLKAVPRERLVQRFRRFPAPVLSGITEAQALRARHELENIGVHVAVEEDDVVVSHSPGSRLSFSWTWLVVPALVVFAVGVYLLVDSEREARAMRAARSAAEQPAPATAPPTVAADAPTDVLNGVARVESAGRQGYGLVVDRDGWLIAALSLVDSAGGITVTLAGQQTRGSLVRKDEQLGLGLFRAATPARYTLTMGDVSTLKAGDAAYVAVEGAGGTELARVAVQRPDARRGARLFLALELPPPVAASVGGVHGAPVFNKEGFVLGLLLPQPGGGGGLAVPANLLVEDVGALMSEIRALRAPTATFAAWKTRVETEARLENPDVYDTVERRLLLIATCDDKRCEAEVGVLSFGERPASQGPLVFDFQDLDQPTSGRDPRYGQQMASPGPAEWVERAPADSPLIQDAAVGARRAIVGGDVTGLRLYVAQVSLQRPPGTLGKAFRIVASGLEGHRSAGTVVALPAAAAPSVAPASQVPPSEPPAGPTPDTVFGDLKAGEWAERFRAARQGISTQEGVLRGYEDQVRRQQPGAQALVERERAQLDLLRRRLDALSADADRWKLPAAFR